MPSRTYLSSRRWFILASFLVLACLGLRLLSLTSRLGQTLTRASYDSLFSLSQPFQPPLIQPPVAIVYLDLESHLREHQDPTAPWNPALHAQLVQRLTTAGARALVFDIVFSDPRPHPDADRQFATALRTHGHAVLGVDLPGSSRATDQVEGIRSVTLTPLTPVLRDAASAWGLVSFRIDDDFVARRYFPGFLDPDWPSLTWATARLLQLPVLQDPTFRNQTRWIRYYGRPFTLPHVNYSAALDPVAVPDSFFRDRIVFIGARPITGLPGERRDEARSPFAAWGDQELFHPGVEVHATQMLNLLRRDSLRRWPATLEALVLVLLAALASAGLLHLRPLAAVTVTLAAATLLLAGSIYGIVQHHFWFPWLIPTALQLPLACTAAVLTQSIDWYRERRRLRTRQRLADLKIREQAALIDKAQDAILLLDLDGRLSYVNPSAQRLYGASPPELEAAGFSQNLLTATPDAGAQARAQALATGRWEGELRQRTLRGRDVTVEGRWTLIRDDLGQPQALLLIHTDITEKKDLEIRFLRTQRLQTIGALAGGIAHDLNNALSPILMGIQLLRRRSPDADAARMLQIMEANTHRGADLVRQVLLFARGRDAEHQLIAPGPLVREIERLLRETFPPNVRLQAHVPGDLWSVRGHSTQLHQILLNLCVNARDAMPHGGQLTLAADNVDVSTAETEGHPDARPGPCVLLLVADTGTGIPPDLLPRIFDPFFSTKGEGHGTGLGLSTVADLVRQHHGFVRVQSTPGEGTTFEIYLPRADTAAPAPAEPAADDLPRGRNDLILVIDDEVAVLTLLATALTDQGYQTLTARSGLEAVPLLEQHHRNLRAVLLDHQMPGWDGARTLQTIRRYRPDLPVIATSAQRDTLPDAFATDGRIDCLPKPFHLDTLFRLLHQRLS